jgi:hypothetical protein
MSVGPEFTSNILPESEIKWHLKHKFYNFFYVSSLEKKNRTGMQTFTKGTRNFTI